MISTYFLDLQANEPALWKRALRKPSLMARLIAASGVVVFPTGQQQLATSEPEAADLAASKFPLSGLTIMAPEPHAVNCHSMHMASHLDFLRETALDAVP